jgi:hypothetical protein
MKIFAAILSLYILVLTVIPCIDEPEGNNIAKIELSQKSTEQQQSINDHCSPFCTCDCCVSPVIYLDYIVETENFLFFHKIYPVYQIKYNSSHYTSIWQPPRIG